MKKKLILGITSGGSSRLLDGQAKYFKDLGYEVYLVSQDHFKETIFCDKEGIQHLPIKDIVADIHPIKDVKALLQIIQHFRRVKPDIVNLGTPKMGLLGMVAAYLIRVKTRIYTCRGLRFETESGIKRKILMLMENLTVRLAHRVIYVSPSLKDTAMKLGVGIQKKSFVIQKGSSNGVDVSYFKRDLINLSERQALLSFYGLEGCLVIGAVGRVTRDKGSYELVEVFEKLSNKYKNLRLIFMGHIKCEPDFEARFRKNKKIIHIPFQNNVPLYMSLFDVLVHPSWREGFPNVPIQAAAMEIPVIISDATGCIDAVSNGYNGLKFQMRNKTQLESCIETYIKNENKIREFHGRNGCKWAQEFNQKVIWEGINKIYNL